MTSILAQAKWSQTAPFCNCKQEKASYICLERTCPAFTTHRLYCHLCLKKGVHKHYEHVDAGEYASGSEGRWKDFKESIDNLAHFGQQSYKAQEPLIRYLETEITQS